MRRRRLTRNQQVPGRCAARVTRKHINEDSTQPTVPTGAAQLNNRRGVHVHTRQHVSDRTRGLHTTGTPPGSTAAAHDTPRHNSTHILRRSATAGPDWQHLFANWEVARAEGVSGACASMSPLGSRGAGSGCSTHTSMMEGTRQRAIAPPPSRGLSCRAHNTATLPRVCLVQANEAGSAFVHVAWHCSATRVIASQCHHARMHARTIACQLRQGGSCFGILHSAARTQA